MTIQEIFTTPVISSLEHTILEISYVVESRGYRYCGAEKEAVKNLLNRRQNELSKMFVMDEAYKQLLYDFNEALKAELIDMRLRTIKAYESVVKAFGENEDIYAEGKCFLDYNYPTTHPIQTMPAKKIWELLNGSISSKYNPSYRDGIAFPYRCSKEERDSQNQLLYLCEKEDNWNDEFFDRDMTKDMHIIYPVHALTCHMNFSIFDFLWVREFNTEITVHIDEKKPLEDF